MGDRHWTAKNPARDRSGQRALFDNEEEEEVHTTPADIIRVTDTSIRSHHHHRPDNMNNTAVHWAWSEIEDPTVQAALKLGMHPKHVAIGKQKQQLRNGVSLQPESVLHQMLRRQNWLGCYFRMNCTSVMRPTETSKRKRRF